MLGITAYGRGAKPKLPPPVREAAAKVIKTTEKTENISLQELTARTDDASNSMKTFVKVMTNTEMKLPPDMNMRDIIALDKNLQLINGQTKLAAANISALEDGIVKLEDILEKEELTPEARKSIEEKVKELTVERDMQRDHLREIEPKIFEVRSIEFVIQFLK